MPTPDPSAPPSRDPPRPAGLECRNCGCRHFHVIETWQLVNGAIRRRRECRHCHWRVTTVERPAGV
jgi:hypothetical protein